MIVSLPNSSIAVENRAITNQPLICMVKSDSSDLSYPSDPTSTQDVLGSSANSVTA